MSRQLPTLLMAATPLLLLPLLLLPLLSGCVAAAGVGSLGAYSVAGIASGRRLDGCLLGTESPVNMTALCADRCRSTAGCQSFSYAESQAACQLHNGVVGSACKLVTDQRWMHCNISQFALPSPSVGVCQSGAECQNGGICLSRTETKNSAFECACTEGFSGEKCQTAEPKPSWSSWSDFGDCSVTCGVGLRARSRNCRLAGAAQDTWRCGAESAEDFTVCNDTVCPSWLGWSAWSSCSSERSCGAGVRVRTRDCASGGVIGRDCLGSASQKIPCETADCDPNVSPVSLYTPVFEMFTVGKGFVEIFNNLAGGSGFVCAEKFDMDKEGAVVCRSLGFEGVQDGALESPVPDFSLGSRTYLLTGLECNGNEKSLQSCQHAGWMNTTQCAAGKAAYVVCKVNGRWSTWSMWTSCDGKCGSAMRNRNRTCTHPRPLGGGLVCEGNDFAESVCPGLQPCPVDGVWQSWSTWGACSAECGGGNRTRTRQCTPPKYGGADCPGAAVDTESCGTEACPVDGYYKPWSDWSACSVTCGGGSQQRSRVCVPPAHDGKPCQGDPSEVRACGGANCPIDGLWGQWSSWAVCSVTCGGGVTKRSRQCDSPVPQFGGANCTGEWSQSAGCNDNNCPVDGYFNTWSAWSSCSLSCGGGQQWRNRSCVPPKFGGADCSGDLSETRACMTQPCPVPGEWLPWKAWGHCSLTCKGGLRLRQRLCNLTTYGDLTAACVGDSEQRESCNTEVECTAVRSCQELRDKGFDYSMETLIDPDGVSGPIQPFKVRCLLSANDSRGYTKVGNNMTLPGVYAHGQEAGGGIVIPVHYEFGATAAALNSLARVSAECSQYVRYTCHDAGIHYQNNIRYPATYWTNYQGLQMAGWGQPYSLRYQSVCACHATASCGTMITSVNGVDTEVAATCNCDRNERKEGVFDDGNIVDRANLPVNDVRVGDTGDDTEWSYTYVGPLICWGSQ